MRWVLLSLMVNLACVSMPLTHEGRQTIQAVKVRTKDVPCKHRAWAFPGEINFCSDYQLGDAKRAASHELQHALVWAYDMHDSDWDEFEGEAMMALQNGNYRPWQIWEAEWYARWGGDELHASLPWILGNEVSPELAPWYPWFEKR